MKEVKLPAPAYRQEGEVSSRLAHGINSDRTWGEQGL